MVSNPDELGAYAYSGHSVLMGEQKRDFQDRDYILGLFGKRERDAKKKYLLFVSKGIEEGEKPELTGGGLIRSVGGRKRLKDLRESGQRVNSDERILGGSEFVDRVLMQANVPPPGGASERRERCAGLDQRAGMRKGRSIITSGSIEKTKEPKRNLSPEAFFHVIQGQKRILEEIALIGPI